MNLPININDLLTVRTVEWERLEFKAGAQSRAQSRAQSKQILYALAKSPLSMLEIVHALKLKSKTGSLKRAVNELLSENYIEYTIPGKPNSRLQKYRLTEKGKKQSELIK